MTMSNTPQRNLYRSRVFAEMPDGSRTDLGAALVAAATPDEAAPAAIFQRWNPDLDALGAIPHTETAMHPRFVHSPGWSHIFISNKKLTTRWIADRTDNSLVHAQVLNEGSNRWYDLTRKEDRADLLASLKDNDVFSDDGASNFELEELDTLPDWVPAHIQVANERSREAAWQSKVREWGLEVGRGATMTGNPNHGTIAEVFEENGTMHVTIEYDTPQPVDAPAGATATRFTMPARNVTSTWIKAEEAAPAPAERG